MAGINDQVSAGLAGRARVEYLLLIARCLSTVLCKPRANTREMVRKLTLADARQY